MKTKIITFIVLLSIPGCNFQPPSKTKPKPELFYNQQTLDQGLEYVNSVEQAVQASGVAIIFKNDEYEGICSVFVLDKVGNKYRLIAAAHCVSDYGDEAAVNLADYKFSIRTEDENHEHNYIEARAIALGDKRNLNDILLLEGESPAALPVLRLAKRPPKLEEDVYLITMRQFELGMQLFKGYVSRAAVTKSVPVGPVLNLKDASVLHIPALGRGQGASGSAIISQETYEFLGIYFGSSEYENGDHISHLAVPADKINSFYRQAKWLFGEEEK